MNSSKISTVFAIVWLITFFALCAIRIVHVRNCARYNDCEAMYTDEGITLRPTVEAHSERSE